VGRRPDAQDDGDSARLVDVPSSSLLRIGYPNRLCCAILAMYNVHGAGGNEYLTPGEHKSSTPTAARL
jgi:hypothetical protein